MEAGGKAIQEHMDTKLFNGDLLGSSSNFSSSNKVDEVLNILLNCWSRESKSGQLLDALILSVNILARVLAVDKVPHFRGGFKLNKARLKLSGAVGKDHSFGTGSGLDSKRAVTWGYSGSQVSLVFIFEQELNGVKPKVEVVGVKLDVNKKVLFVGGRSETLNLLVRLRSCGGSRRSYTGSHCLLISAQQRRKDAGSHSGVGLSM